MLKEIPNSFQIIMLMASQQIVKKSKKTLFFGYWGEKFDGSDFILGQKKMVRFL